MYICIKYNIAKHVLTMFFCASIEEYIILNIQHFKIITFIIKSSEPPQRTNCLNAPGDISCTSQPTLSGQSKWSGWRMLWGTNCTHGRDQSAGVQTTSVFVLVTLTQYWDMYILDYPGTMTFQYFWTWENPPDYLLGKVTQPCESRLSENTKKNILHHLHLSQDRDLEISTN